MIKIQPPPITSRIDVHFVFDVRMVNNSGIGRYIRALIPALANTFSKVTLLGKPEQLTDFSGWDTISVLPMKSPIYSLAEQVELYSVIPTCDIFLSPQYNVPFLTPKAKLRLVIIPDVNHLVFKKDLSLPKRIYAKLFYKMAVHKSELVFTISDFSKSEIIKYTGCKPSKVIVSKCAIDKAHFSSLKLELENGAAGPGSEIYREMSYIVYVGNIKPHKNLKRSLLAFKKIVPYYPDLNFVIVGKKDGFITGDPEVFSMIGEDEELKRKIIFTGKISDLLLAYLYTHAQLLLFPSLYEGFGLTPLEAMYFDCPVLTSHEASLPEVCDDAALYCDAYDVQDITAKLLELLADTGLKGRLVEKGRRRVASYDWSSFTILVMENIVNLVSLRHSRPARITNLDKVKMEEVSA